MIDDDIDTKILDGGVEVLFDDFREAMNFIDEEDISLLEAREQAGEVACFFDGRARGGTDRGIHLCAENVSESCFAEARGSAEEKVIEGLRSGACGVDQDAETVF